MFLVDKLNFSWDEVHDIAEQLEHIKSPELTHRLDLFLGRPKVDPHGDPIPDENGRFLEQNNRLLSQCEIAQHLEIVGVSDTSSEFLRYLDSKNLNIGVKLILLEKQEYDKSILIELNDQQLTLSEKVSNNILVR